MWNPTNSWRWTRTVTGNRKWPACRIGPVAVAVGDCAKGDDDGGDGGVGDDAVAVERARRRPARCRRAHRVARSGQTAARRAWR